MRNASNMSNGVANSSNYIGRLCGANIEAQLENLTELSRIWDSVVLVVYLLVTAAGLLGNGLILLVSIRARQYRRSAVHTYVTHLAAADLFFLAICAPVHSIVFFLASAWPLGNTMCKLLHFLQPLAMHASAAFLTAMAVDRCLSVSGLGAPGSSGGCGAAGSMRGNRRSAAAPRYAAALWAGAVLVALPWPLVYRVENGVCTYELAEDGLLKVSLFIGRAALGYAIPFVIIAACSVRMLRRLWRFGRHRGGANSRRVIALVVALVFSFFSCWLPLHVADIISGFFVCQVFLWPGVTAADLLVLNRFTQITILLSYCNACANPAIYSCLSESSPRPATDSGQDPPGPGAESQETRLSTGVTSVIYQKSIRSSFRTISHVTGVVGHNRDSPITHCTSAISSTNPVPGATQPPQPPRSRQPIRRREQLSHPNLRDLVNQSGAG